MMVMSDGSPPPTASLVAKFAGGDPVDYAMPGMILHLIYGVVAGGVFAVAVPVLGLSLGSIRLAVGLVYGIILILLAIIT
jgi:uncharacterized membrane protein YagU involved in acid resistance